MRLSRFLPLVLAVAAGCALASQGSAPQDPETRLQQGLDALAAQDLVTAREHLEWVYANHPSEPVGTYAYLALIAAELDPRSPTASRESATAMSGALLHSPDAPAWSRPVAQSFQLLAMEISAKERRIERLEYAAHAANGTEQPPLEEVIAERDRLRGRVSALQDTVGTVKKELDEKKAELERIKKTIKG